MVLLGTVSVYLANSSAMRSVWSTPALFRIWTALARLRRMVSKIASRDSTSSGVAPMRTMPKATPSSMPWDPPWPWSMNCQLCSSGKARTTYEEAWGELRRQQ
jgi:hypothetical protein